MGDVPASAIEELREKYQDRYEKAKGAGFTAEYVTMEEFVDDLDELLDEHAAES
jgi:flagellar biosynthesis chaperone FliJ